MKTKHAIVIAITLLLNLGLSATPASPQANQIKTTDNEHHPLMLALSKSESIPPDDVYNLLDTHEKNRIALETSLDTAGEYFSGA